MYVLHVPMNGLLTDIWRFINLSNNYNNSRNLTSPILLFTQMTEKYLGTRNLTI